MLEHDFWNKFLEQTFQNAYNIFWNKFSKTLLHEIYIQKKLFEKHEIFFRNKLFEMSFLAFFFSPSFSFAVTVW